MLPPSPTHELAAGPFSLVRVYADEAALTQALAAALWNQVEQARKSGPRAIMLSGGSTPLNAYALLSAQGTEPVPSPLHGFLSDERYVPPSDPGYNFAYARPFLQSFNPEVAAHPAVETSLPLADAAAQYGERVDQLISTVRFAQGFLGMGADGHTAGLFTPEHLEQGTDKSAIGLHRPDQRDGVTLTSQTICRAEQLCFVVGGPGKKDRLQSLCADPQSAVAGRIAAQHGQAELWTDLAAWDA